LAGASAGEIGSLVWLTESKGNHQSPHETKACEHKVRMKQKHANTEPTLPYHWVATGRLRFFQAFGVVWAPLITGSGSTEARADEVAH
jgi:hypothetical protein